MTSQETLDKIYERFYTEIGEMKTELHRLEYERREIIEMLKIYFSPNAPETRPHEYTEEQYMRDRSEAFIENLIGHKI